MGFFVSRHLGLLLCNITIMKRLCLILFVPAIILCQDAEKEDSTVVVLKTGEIKEVQDGRAYIHFVNPLKMNIEVIDEDSIKYDIYDIESIKDKTGKTLLSKRTISLLKVVKATCEVLALIGLIWVIIY